MNKRLKLKIASGYPYPLTVDFLRLNTNEYKNPGIERLTKTLEVSEIIIQFLALISISDLLENVIHKKVTVPDNYKARFRNNFTQTSFGKWIELVRETIRIFKLQKQSMFIEELVDYFYKASGGEATAQSSFNRLVSIRNSLQHKEKHFSSSEINNLCSETDVLLETILKELEFLIDYDFLYVDKVTIEYHRWADPVFSTDMSQLIGNNPDLFDSLNDNIDPKSMVHTPAIIIAKSDFNHYLNLEPLVIYSDEGEMNIKDVFMYIGWDKSKNKISFKPIWKGGAFNLTKSSLHEVLIPAFLKIMHLLADEKDYQSFLNQYK